MQPLKHRKSVVTLYRKIGNYIVNHLQSESNKILIIDGARQIGKSYIIREVGKKLFPYFIELNMETDKVGEQNFANAKTVDDFYLALSAVAGEKMREKQNTLVFIDEIQAYDHLLTLLKFLREDDKFMYICSGSLLGVTLKTTSSIPLGCIEIKHMYPLDFEEFLIANGVGELVLSTMRKKFANREAMPDAIHNKLLDLSKKMYAWQVPVRVLANWRIRQRDFMWRTCLMAIPSSYHRYLPRSASMCRQASSRGELLPATLYFSSPTQPSTTSAFWSRTSTWRGCERCVVA